MQTQSKDTRVFFQKTNFIVVVMEMVMDRELVWTVSRDADGTFRLTESSESHGPFTLVTSSDKDRFYRMVALRKLRAEDKGLDIAFHDTTTDINKSDSHVEDWDGATMNVGSN